MFCLSYIRSIVLLLAMLLSQFASAWSDQFEDYFNVITRDDNTMIISQRNDINIDGADLWVKELAKYLFVHGPLEFISISSNVFIVRHDAWVTGSSDRALTMRITVRCIWRNLYYAAFKQSK